MANRRSGSPREGFWPRRSVARAILLQLHPSCPRLHDHYGPPARGHGQRDPGGSKRCPRDRPGCPGFPNSPDVGLAASIHLANASQRDSAERLCGDVADSGKRRRVWDHGLFDDPAETGNWNSHRLGSHPRGHYEFDPSPSWSHEGIGVVLGILLALPVIRLLSALLFQVSPFDGEVLIAVAVALVAIGLAAAAIPAFRAANIDPSEAIRSE